MQRLVCSPTFGCAPCGAVGPLQQCTFGHALHGAACHEEQARRAPGPQAACPVPKTQGKPTTPAACCRAVWPRQVPALLTNTQQLVNNKAQLLALPAGANCSDTCPVQCHMSTLHACRLWQVCSLGECSQSYGYAPNDAPSTSSYSQPSSHSPTSDPSSPEWR